MHRVKKSLKVFFSRIAINLFNTSWFTILILADLPMCTCERKEYISALTYVFAVLIFPWTFFINVNLNNVFLMTFITHYLWAVWSVMFIAIMFYFHIWCEKCGMFWCHFICMKTSDTYSKFIAEKCRFCSWVHRQSIFWRKSCTRSRTKTPHVYSSWLTLT